MRLIHHLKFAVKEGKFWLLFNILGIAAYLAIEAWIFAPRIPEEAFNGIDQICFWETQEFPLLMLCSGVNVTWLFMSRESPFFKQRQLLIFLLVCLIWGIVIGCDPIAVKIIVFVIPLMLKFFWRRHFGMP